MPTQGHLGGGRTQLSDASVAWGLWTGQRGEKLGGEWKQHSEPWRGGGRGQWLRVRTEELGFIYLF